MAPDEWSFMMSGLDSRCISSWKYGKAPRIWGRSIFHFLRFLKVKVKVKVKVGVLVKDENENESQRRKINLACFGFSPFPFPNSSFHFQGFIRIFNVKNYSKTFR